MKALKLILKGIAYTLAGLFAIGLVAGLAGVNRSDGSSSAASTSAPALAEVPIDVTAQALAASYERNSVAADETFKGRALRITGRIVAINTDVFNHAVLVLDGRVNEFLQPQATLQDSERGQAARVSVGQTVRLLCTGAGDVVKAPMMKDCSFL